MARRKMNFQTRSRKLLATTNSGEKIYGVRTPRPETLVVEGWKDTGRALTSAMQQIPISR
ncbi:hypothetical protein CKF53_07950 [Corynebacterium striatum]|uniref:Uncharacterized protein n=1 Tax=Corynebacterium striatum TaxID=43770 RepID=A0ABC9ZPY6_CORST|nr:hypothetical protein HMPREF0308_0191 [Corynebacterium striatum ATCC 6940]KAA1271107.1 hypothetical protein D7S42_03285 [Corynebacterium striatum]OFT64216.1 hypothetical protein HMPREF3148_03695 [Corynebacterium sp. HMSC05D08]PIS61560.1 hypothetical protein AZH45_07805 [Corynebacterium striatum]PIS65622.1 hypothetical protein AZH44_13280 [Corynebacterium striatum]